MADSIAILINRAPYGTEEAFAGMREALALMVSGLVERTVTILMGEGTLNAVPTQKPEAIGMPSNLAALNDLVDMDGEVYLVQEDLDHLAQGVEVPEGVKTVSWPQAREIISSCQLVTTF
ncbi:MAG: DsrE family protein [Candidatus Methanomethylophilaceae archaeon]|jgi:sulfur relay (sulfurtransferase) DsrF/TusC family protein